MLKIPRKPAKRPMETTISLINIVFLMLIFFLVAGRLSPPMDSEVTLAESRDAPSLPPPDALYARVDGGLYYRDSSTTASAYVAGLGAGAVAPPPEIRLAADAALPAHQLINHVDALYAAGAGTVVVVTRKAAP